MDAWDIWDESAELKGKLTIAEFGALVTRAADRHTS